jgi:hypothetical protein
MDVVAFVIELTRLWLHPDNTLRVIVDGAYSQKTLLMNRPPSAHITGKLRLDAALYALVEHPTVNGITRPRLIVRFSPVIYCPKPAFHYSPSGFGDS